MGVERHFEEAYRLAQLAKNNRTYFSPIINEYFLIYSHTFFANIFNLVIFSTQKYSNIAQSSKHPLEQNYKT